MWCMLLNPQHCTTMRLTHPLLRPKARPKKAVWPTDSDGSSSEQLWHADQAIHNGTYVDFLAPMHVATQPRPTSRPTDVAAFGGEQLLMADPGTSLGVCVDSDVAHGALNAERSVAPTSLIAMPTSRRSQATWERKSGRCSVNAHPKKAGILEDVTGKRHQCAICLLRFLRQEVLIQPAQHGDWQGQLSILCYSCHRKQHPWLYCSHRGKDRAKPLSDAAARRQFHRNQRRSTMDWKRHMLGDAIHGPHRIHHSHRFKQSADRCETPRTAALLDLTQRPLVV